MHSSLSTMGSGDPVQVCVCDHSIAGLMQVCGLEVNLGYTVKSVCKHSFVIIKKYFKNSLLFLP